MLRTAIIRGLRPTTLLLNKQPYSKWNALDRRLVRVYQIFEDETSSTTGLPLWVARSLDPAIDFIVEERTDRATAALEEWDAKLDPDPKKRPKGIVRYAVPHIIDGPPLEYGGLTREAFRNAAIQEEQDREDDVDIVRERPKDGYNPADYGDGLT